MAVTHLALPFKGSEGWPTCFYSKRNENSDKGQINHSLSAAVWTTFSNERWKTIDVSDEQSVHSLPFSCRYSHQCLLVAATSLKITAQPPLSHDGKVIPGVRRRGNRMIAVINTKPAWWHETFHSLVDFPQRRLSTPPDRPPAASPRVTRNVADYRGVSKAYKKATSIAIYSMVNLAPGFHVHANLEK